MALLQGWSEHASAHILFVLPCHPLRLRCPLTLVMLPDCVSSTIPPPQSTSSPMPLLIDLSADMRFDGTGAWTYGLPERPGELVLRHAHGCNLGDVNGAQNMGIGGSAVHASNHRCCRSSDARAIWRLRHPFPLTSHLHPCNTALYCKCKCVHIVCRCTREAARRTQDFQSRLLRDGGADRTYAAAEAIPWWCVRTPALMLTCHTNRLTLHFSRRSPAAVSL